MAVKEQMETTDFDRNDFNIPFFATGDEMTQDIQINDSQVKIKIQEDE